MDIGMTTHYCVAIPIFYGLFSFRMPSAMFELSVENLQYNQHNGDNDNQDTDNFQASVVSAATVVVIGRSISATAAGTRTEAAIECLLVMGVARAALAEVTIVFRHDFLPHLLELNFFEILNLLFE